MRKRGTHFKEPEKCTPKREVLGHRKCRLFKKVKGDRWLQWRGAGGRGRQRKGLAWEEEVAGARP